MAELSPSPHPPGAYPVVIVGSGAGAIQASYSLRRLGVGHAVISEDEAPGGMFRRFPFFQRLITWSKPQAPVERGSRAYEWYDWNSLLADEPEHMQIALEVIDRSSVFPSREEMERALVAFVERTSLPIRYGCTWESTRRQGERFVLETSDGEYECEALIVAVGMTQPWRPDIPGMDAVPHYVETREPRTYEGKRVVIVGKRNSGFELADGLLPWARQIILASPRPAQISVFTHSTSAARARYLQPYEDDALGGHSVFVLDAAIERVERHGDGWRVHAKGTTVPMDHVLDADEVIAATGFATPLRDLPALGVATFYQGGRLPAQSPYWESASLPGVYFAGSITQGSIGLKKYGRPSSSAAVHGFRYNARVLAEHLAHTRFGLPLEQRLMRREDVVPYLLEEATLAPELWNQQSYLARLVSFSPGASIVDAGIAGIVDEGIVPLAHFVDEAGPDAVAMTVETDDRNEIHPAVYCRRGGRVDEHTLPADPMHEFRGREHRTQLTSVLKGYLE